MKKLFSFVLSTIISVNLCLTGYAFTKDTFPPKVQATNLVNHNSGVITNQTIKIYFNEDIVKNKRYANISLKKSNGTTESYKATIIKNTLSIIPVKRLSNNTKYYLNIPSGAISDKSSNPTKKGYTFTFKTIGAVAEQASTPASKPTPTVAPTPIPTVEPTLKPTTIPTVIPTIIPTSIPSVNSTTSSPELTTIPSTEPTPTPTVNSNPTSSLEPTPTPIFTVISTPTATSVPTTVAINNLPKHTSEQLKLWGLGNTEQEYVSNTRNYDWYIDQGDTGTYSDSNCGPSSTTMVAKWFDSSFSKTAEDARNTYKASGGWWFTDDITNYMDKYKIPFKVIDNYGKDIAKTLTSSLSQGNIFILCVDTSYLPQNKAAEQRVGRFYDYKGGHFIVVKGYVKVDDIIYFQVYDPNNWNAKYSDGTQKGKDRYYKSNELIDSVQYWWNYCIQIQPKATGSGSSPELENVIIPRQHGGTVKSND